MQYGIDRANQIAVGGNQHRRVKSIMLRVAEQCHGNVDVGHFLLKSFPGRSAAPAGSDLGQVMPVLDAQVGQGCQCFQVNILAQGLFRIVGLRVKTGGEVPDHRQTLARSQQTFRQAAQVKPVILAPVRVIEAVVEVEAIHVHRHAVGRQVGGIGIGGNKG